MKLNVVGIVGGILAFVTIALPWWVETLSTTLLGTSYSLTFSWNTYGTATSCSPTGSAFCSLVSSPSTSSFPPSWAGYGAMALVIVGGILAIVGSVLTMSKAKLMLLGGGVLDLLSLVVFVLGFSAAPSGGTCGGYSLIFCSQSLSGASVSAYLTYGYWIALVAGILSIVAMKVGTMGGAGKMAPAPSAPTS